VIPIAVTEITIVKEWALLKRCLQLCTSANALIPRQFEGWSCFVRKEQPAVTTSSNCSILAIPTSFSTLSSLISIFPVHTKKGLYISVMWYQLPGHDKQIGTHVVRLVVQERNLQLWTGIHKYNQVFQYAMIASCNWW